jgi:P pilus assembly protein, pilin FimA
MLSTGISALGRAVLFLSLFTTGMALAGNKTSVVIAGGVVHLQGSVTTGACAVSPDSLDKVVVMGKIRTNQFTGLGTWAEPVPFTLQLVDCNTAISQQVGMVFRGVIDGKDPLVFRAGQGAGAAQGIGIGLFDSEGRLIIPDARPRYLTGLTNGTVSVPFTARYRATSQTVSPGDASAVVDFSLFYP